MKTEAAHELKRLAEAAVMTILTAGPDDAIAPFDTARAALSPWQMAQLDEPLRQVHRNELDNIRRKNRTAVLTMPGRLTPSERALSAIRSDARVARLFAHAHSGYHREAALRAVPIDPDDTTAQIILILRCNDWVPAVRAAACARLSELAPRLSEDDLARIALFVIERVPQYQRGGVQALEIVKSNPRWSNAVESAFATEINGPVLRIFRIALRDGQLDHALVRLATLARSASIRAAAVDSVLQRKARWLVGYRRQWVDKPMGISRRELLFDERRLDIAPADYAHVVRAAARDKAVSVRKHLADAFIRERAEAFEPEVNLLTNDKAQSVRDRMAFRARKWASTLEQVDE